ncbi:MAG: hypothetical protein IJT96_03545 [Lachnospiraceae bacterium]|nr:hypothetical protein [Lachnospiraceae bacterium]
MIILDAAIRFIRSKGINPDKITYEQVAEGIEKLNTRASDRKQWHRQLSAELKGMEKGEAYLTRLKPYWQKFKYQLDYIPFKP